MRAIVNLSLPKQMADVVEEYVASGKYATKSEFFRSLLREWMEDQLVKEIKESRAEIAAGKGIRLRSLKDLR